MLLKLFRQIAIFLANGIGVAGVAARFALDFVDRDVPPDVRLYQEKDGKLVEYTRGIDPQSLQRERPPRPGANKFTTRVLTAGATTSRSTPASPITPSAPSSSTFPRT